MLLIDDEDELSDVPDDAESRLVAEPGADGLEQIDEALRKHADTRWLKVARIVAYAVKEGGFSPTDETAVRLHVRRVGTLVKSGLLESQGSLRRARFSEVRIARTTC